MQHSLKDRLKASILRSSNQVFVRGDFDRFGGYRQVTRALGELEKNKVLIRAGYGIYTKPTSNMPIDMLVTQVRGRLGKRVNRTVTFDGATVQLGRKTAQFHNAQTRLDEFKLRLAAAILEKFDLPTIRARSLSNLARWKSNGVWCSAYDEWLTLLEGCDDAVVVAAMTGSDERANRLRQSPPYTGLLDEKTIGQLREKAGA